ncbi:murein transglycosylase A [Stappia sp. ES.058]|uniref:murein transglycosylase A n=1 Tax=Stappia sp. ES.058 TaxID=1881061 RepID=UPI001AD907FF|nr:MltA domain-containing protein [Stappia sp. ES.058]
MPLQPISFSDISGWQDDDHTAALEAFLRHCASGSASGAAPRTGELGVSGASIVALCGRARAAAATGEGDAARHFFEAAFQPHLIAAKGFVTGYFEPEFAGARKPDAIHRTPLLRKPDGLEILPEGKRPDGLADTLTHAFRDDAGRFVEAPDRGAIMDGALDGRGLELVWLADPVDAFYIHVQGSARIRLADGGHMRVGYAGKNGHPYSPIGRVMIERGLADPGTVTMSVLRDWLAENPQEIDGVLRRNRSYIFFREIDGLGPDEGPVGAAGLPLVAGRSLAVDASLHTYGTPVFVSATMPAEGAVETRPFRRLMIAEDTGSAIVGPARGDIFFGTGDAAGRKAGGVQHAAEMTVLLPLAQAGVGEARR